MLTFTKKEIDSTTIKRTKMVKWLYYYGTEGIVIKREGEKHCHK